MTGMCPARAAVAAVNQKVLPSPGALLHADLAAHQLRQPARDRQTEPGAAVACAWSRHRPVRTPGTSRRSCPGRCRCRCPEPRSAPAVRRPDSSSRRARRTMEPLLGEFDGVAGVVEQRLAQPRRIAAQPERHAVSLERHAPSPLPRPDSAMSDCTWSSTRGEVQSRYALQLAAARPRSSTGRGCR